MTNSYRLYDIWWEQWIFIEFKKNKYWPYTWKFSREDCYFDESIGDRGSFKFPYKNRFNNTEIFLETNDLIICSWIRATISSKNKSFIDIINIKNAKKLRIYTDEVNIIYNEKENIFLNLKEKWAYKSKIYGIDNLELKEEKSERLSAFFKLIYNHNQKKYYLLDYASINWEKDWYFRLISQEGSLNYVKEPLVFHRKEFKLEIDYKKAGLYYWNDYWYYYMDIWAISNKLEPLWYH